VCVPRRSDLYSSEDSVRALWIVPIEGGMPPRPIVDFAWSHNGKRLAVLRESTSSDIVLIKRIRRK